MMTEVLWGLTLLSIAFWVVAWYCVDAFFNAQPYRSPTYQPMVSILKPVKGIDAEAYENFASFCCQDYPCYELLFGVADRNDPTVDVVRRLQTEFSEIPIHIVYVGSHAANPKSAILEELTRRAEGEVLIASDSDVRVTPGYLRRVVSPLADPGVGMVTCPYYSRACGTLGSRLQALHLNACFLPSLILAVHLLKMRVGLGPTIAVRRHDLIRAGGYGGIADFLTDDYEIATRVAHLGLRVELSDYVVQNIQDAASVREAWEREVRWSSGIRVNCGVRYLGIGLTFTLPFALGAAAVDRFSTGSLGLLAATLVIRSLLAWRMLSILDGRRWHPEIAWLPLREFLSMLVWGISSLGRRITWRGHEFRLLSDGRLESMG